MIGMLNTLSREEANRILVSLRSETNASVVLSVLRDETELAGANNSASGTNNSSSPFEFEVQYPIAYPVTSSPNPIEQGQDSYLDLTPFS